MKVQWLGEPQGPDEITMRGFTFERKGEPVEVPDDHPHAEKFINNHYFKVQKAVKETAPPIDADDEPADEAPKQPRAPRAVPKAKPGKPGPKAKAAPKAEPADEHKAGEDPEAA